MNIADDDGCRSMGILNAHLVRLRRAKNPYENIQCLLCAADYVMKAKSNMFVICLLNMLLPSNDINHIQSIKTSN